MSANPRRELLMLKIRDAISCREAAVATANRQLDCGGWLTGWDSVFHGIDLEVAALVAEIEDLDKKEASGIYYYPQRPRS